MMLIAWLPIVVALLGALTYGLASGKASELGRLAFLVGLLVAVYLASHGHLSVVRWP